MSDQSQSERTIGNRAERGPMGVQVLGWVLGGGVVGIFGFSVLSSTGYWLMLPPTLRYGAFAVLGLLVLFAGLAFRWLSRRLVRVPATVSARRAAAPVRAVGRHSIEC